MKTTCSAVALGLAVVVGSSLALADQTIKTPGDHPHYKIEVEPHGLVGFDAFGWGGFGFGAGLRASVPLMENGFIPKINNIPAITFGVDWMHFEGGCWYGFYNSCSANSFYFPVGLQWNFFVAKSWSVFAEIGISPYYTTFGDYCGVSYVPGSRDYLFCEDRTPNHLRVEPWGSVGGRYHFNEHVALTMRLGLPSLSVGVSFM